MVGIEMRTDMTAKNSPQLPAGPARPLASYSATEMELDSGLPSDGSLGPFALNTIQCVDCIEGMRQIPTDSVDIVIADPPYNASKGNRWKWDSSNSLPGFGGDWIKFEADWDNLPLEE